MNNSMLPKVILIKFGVYGVLYLATGWILFSLFVLTPKEIDGLHLLRFVIVMFASILLTKYFLYMFISPWHDVATALRKRTYAAWDNFEHYGPKVSVILPAWNEEVGVITTLEGLLGSMYRHMEIIVVNNASTDNTEERVLAFIQRHERSESLLASLIKVKYCVEALQGKGHALNRGLALATGDIIISIDADCYVPPQSIGEFVKCFRDPRIAAAVGNVRIGNTSTLLGVLQYLEFLFSFYFKKGDSLMNTVYIIGGAAGAFRREVFEKIGPYNPENITEDIELSVRIQDAGMKIAYADNAVVYTEGASDIKGLMKQRLRWKRGRFQTFLEHRHLFFSTKRRHNKLLTWFILPFALFGDLQLSLEMFFLAFLYVFSYLTSDYSSFISGIIVVSSMFVIQMLFEKYRPATVGFVLLAPIGWLLFYISTFVESNALFRALWGHVRGVPLSWQQWQRRGVFSKQV